MSPLFQIVCAFSPRLWLALSFLAGAGAGLGFFTFTYAEGFSYFGGDPQTCANCHIMRAEYDSWRKGPHHAAAGCGDCHLPASLPAKLAAKADNGRRHAQAFTLRNFHEPIQITPRNAEILQENCLRCHGDFVHEIRWNGGAADEAKNVRCARCHLATGHGAPQ